MFLPEIGLTHDGFDSSFEQHAVNLALAMAKGEYGFAIAQALQACVPLPVPGPSEQAFLHGSVVEVGALHCDPQVEAGVPFARHTVIQSGVPGVVLLRGVVKFSTVIRAITEVGLAPAQARHAALPCCPLPHAVWQGSAIVTGLQFGLPSLSEPLTL